MDNNNPEEKKNCGSASQSPIKSSEQEIKAGATQTNPNNTSTESQSTQTVTLSEATYLDLKQKSEKANELRDRILRLQADFENSRKRWERDKQEYIRFAQEEVLVGLLNITDDFERSLKVAPARIEDLPNFIKGMEMIFSHLQELIKKNGVTPMSAEGKLFDPNLHEALMIVEKDELPENTIVAELQKGYFLHNRLLRVARVQLSKKKVTPQNTSENTSSPS